MASTADPITPAAWLSAPELHDPLERIARGEESPEDLERFVDAAPPEQRVIAPFLARCIRVWCVLHDVRRRASECARMLTRRALAERDEQAALGACKLIVNHNLLEGPAEPRVVGRVLERGWALELEPDEGVLVHAVLPTPSGSRAMMALVATATAGPPPKPLDEATEDRIADAIADAFCQREGL